MNNELLRKINSLSSSLIQKVSEESNTSTAAILNLSSGATIYGAYWRLLSTARNISSFDHRQKYGLNTPINAIDSLREVILNKKIISTSLDPQTGDLEIKSEAFKLQIFNFSGYEVWEVKLPNDETVLSNHLF